MTTRIILTYDLAMAISTDAGNRHMRKHGRTAWNDEDYNVSVIEFHKHWPCPDGANCELCHPAIAAAFKNVEREGN
jgi:hypothetical protein